MDIKIYQINMDRDKDNLKFMGTDMLEHLGKSTVVDPSIYDEVLHAPLEVESPEDVYLIFNTEHHPLFRGHSLSVSDVVVMDGKKLFCDSVGFKEIAFDESLASKPDNLMRVLYVEPHKAAFEAEIEDSLEAMQKAVHGLIEVIYIGDPSVTLVGNEEAKLIGMEGNRRVNYGATIIAGPFFVVGDDGEEFRSLTDEEVVKYMAEFAEPEDISPEEVAADTGFYIY